MGNTKLSLTRLLSIIALAAIYAASELPAASADPQYAHVRYPAGHYRPTPPDSFLPYKVYSVDELVSAAETNPRVRLMYARNFNVPEDRIVQYMRANLVPSYVPDTQVYTVYCARKDGTIYPVRETLRQGTKVFALRNGQPLMKWVCGNPLSRFLPTVSQAPDIKVLPSLETMTPADTTRNVLVPTEIDAPAYQPTAAVLVNTGSATEVSGGSGGSPWWLLGIPVIVASIGHTGGGSHVPLAPEPSGATASLIMMLGFGLWIA